MSHHLLWDISLCSHHSNFLQPNIEAMSSCRDRDVFPQSGYNPVSMFSSDLLLMPSPCLTLSQIVQWLINTAELRTSNPLMLVLLWLDIVNYYNLISHNTSPSHTFVSTLHKSDPHKNRNVNYPSHQWNPPIWLDNRWVLLMVRTEQFADGAVVVVVAVEKYNNKLDNLISLRGISI